MTNLFLQDEENALTLFFRIANGFGDSIYTVADAHVEIWHALNLNELKGDKPKHNDVVVLRANTDKEKSYRIKVCPGCGEIHTILAMMVPRSKGDNCPRCAYTAQFGVAEEIAKEVYGESPE